MAASAADVARLRRMVAEPTDGTYSDRDLRGCIERYPVLDERGEAPYTWDASTTPPTRTANAAWVATYDLHAAAAEVWDEKAAALAGNFDLTADGTTLRHSQTYEHAQAQARYHRSRRRPSTVAAQAWPKQTDNLAWIANLPEGD